MNIRHHLAKWLDLRKSHPDQGTREFADRQVTRYARRINATATDEECSLARRPLPEDFLSDEINS